MSAETAAGRTASLPRQHFVENAEQANQERARRAGAWPLQQHGLPSAPVLSMEKSLVSAAKQR